MAACPQTESRTETISYTEFLTRPEEASGGGWNLAVRLDCAPQEPQNSPFGSVPSRRGPMCAARCHDLPCEGPDRGDPDLVAARSRWSRHCAWKCRSLN